MVQIEIKSSATWNYIQYFIYNSLIFIKCKKRTFELHFPDDIVLFNMSSVISI